MFILSDQQKKPRKKTFLPRRKIPRIVTAVVTIATVIVVAVVTLVAVMIQVTTRAVTAAVTVVKVQKDEIPKNIIFTVILNILHY